MQRRTIVICLLLLFLGVASFFLLGDRLSDPEAYESLIDSIDAKEKNALKLTGIVTVASAGITMLPDDIATPVAEEMADLTQYFLIAMFVLLAEKYLLPLTGLAVFRILIPLVCLLGILYLLTKRGAILGQLSLRLLLFGLVLWIAIPAGIKASDVIYRSYEASMENLIEDAEELTEDVSLFSSSEGTGFIERATTLVNRLLESLAVTIATSCIIPILVLLFFLWLSKIVLGVTLPSPLPRGRKRLSQEAAELPRLPEAKA